MARRTASAALSDLPLLEPSDDDGTVVGPSVRLLQAAAHAGHEWPWPSAERRIASERGAVERWITAGGTAYGFTTLVGHLADADRETVRSLEEHADLEAKLLRAHLVAESMLTAVGAVATRCIIGAKLLQLSCGGSGISLSTYRAFVDAWASLGDVELPVDLSYSCGDVIPAAWLLDRVVDPDRLSQGDVIAGISGSHVSTGLGAIALARSTLVARAILAWFGHHLDSARDGRATQAPVSLRAGSDLGPLMNDSLRELELALDARLSSPAANPHFEVREGSPLTVTSTSAFLDYRLSAALASVRTALLMGAHHTVALHVALERSHGSASTLTLQYPKALRAFQSRLLQRFGGGAPFLLPVEGASEGLEDAADHSLHLASDVSDLAGRLEALLRVASEHAAALRLPSLLTSGTSPGGVLVGPALEQGTLESIRDSSPLHH